MKEAILLAAEGSGATLRLLHVAHDDPVVVERAGIIDFGKYREGMRPYGQKVLDDCEALARSFSLKVETRLLSSAHQPVADAILEESRTADCDLIVIETHGRRGIERVGWQLLS